MEMSGQLHALTLRPSHPGERPPVRIGQEAGWAPEWYGRNGGKKKSLPCTCRESKPARPARSLVTILTELLRLRRQNYNLGSCF
jgi:hypothetical protein